MSYKQIFLNLDESLISNARTRSAEKEKRSLTAQIRKLFSDLEQDELFLELLGEKLTAHRTLPNSKDNLVKLTIKVPDAEFWEIRIKSAMSRLMPGEFITALLEAWLNNELDDLIEEAWAMHKEIQSQPKRATGS